MFLSLSILSFYLNDIPENDRLSRAIQVEVRSIQRSENPKIDSVVTVEDSEGAPVDLKIWATHGLTPDLTEGHRYELRGVRGTSWLKNGTRYYELSSTREFQATDLGPVDDDALRLLVVGDTHVGYRHRQQADKVKSARRLDARQSFRQVLEQAQLLGVDAIIHAGDIFDHVATGYDRDFVIDLLTDEFRGIPFYYVYGNHDVPASRHTLDGATSNTAHVGRLTSSAIEIDSPGVNIVGVDYANSSFPGDSLTLPATNAPTNILVAHDTPYPVRNSQNQLLHKKNGADYRDVITASPLPIDLIVSGHMHVGQTGTLDDHEIPVVVTGAPAPIFKGNRDTVPSTWLLRITDESEPTVSRQPL